MPGAKVDSQEEQEEARSKHRSPNYPFVSLPRAVQLAQVLYDKDKRLPVPILIAHDRWGYKKGGAAGNQCIAALKAYSLLSVEGHGDKRKVAISDTAHRILLKAPDRAQLLWQAALGPSIHGEIWEHYKGEPPAQDDVLRLYLVLERNFNEDSVAGFIARFRETMAFAKPQVANTPSEKEKEKPQVMRFEGFEGVDLFPPKPKQPEEKSAMREIKVPLASGDAVLHVPAKMNEADYRLLTIYLNAAHEADKARQQFAEQKQQDKGDISK